MTTRPILKSRPPRECLQPVLATLPVIGPPNSPHVHFPPTPTLTSTHTTHSPFAYDRAPIVVSPNICALPERGGRVYSPQTSPVFTHKPPKGCYFHPRAFEACEREVLDERFNTPLLIPDLSSSSSSETSDDSEVDNNPPAPSSIPLISIGPSQDFTYPLSQSHSPEQLAAALSFLPHPPSVRKDRRKPKKQGTGDCFQSVTSELSIEGCLGGF